MGKRLLFMEDLQEFYEKTYKRSTKFSSAKTGEPLVVQVHGKIDFEETDKSKDGLLAVHLQSCHTNLNVNGSFISEENMTNALPSFSNRPILGYIHKVEKEDGEFEWNFYGHNMHEEDDELVYDEIPIGIIPESCNAQLVYDEEKEKTYVEVDGYIYEDYSKASEILKREEECPVSIEIAIRELSYNAKEKHLDIEDFWFSGVTILGKTPNGDAVKPGMQGSNIKLKDFSAENNSLMSNYQSQMIEFQARLEKLESACFNKTLSEEGGETIVKLDELLAKYSVALEDLTFEVEGMSDEELEAKFEEVFGGEPEGGEEPTDGDGENPSDDTADDGEGESDAEPTAEPVDDTPVDGEGEAQTGEQFEEMVKTFAISHEDIRYALYNLLSPVEEQDNEWYCIRGVYDDYFVYESWSGGSIWGQKYTKENDNISFDGERYELFKEYITKSEKVQLDEMRSNYSSIVEELATYKSAEDLADKMEVFADEAYAEYLETEEFKAIMAEEYVKQFTKEELVEKADATLGKLVKTTKTFAASTPKKRTGRVAVHAESQTEETYKPYGDLFD